MSGVAGVLVALLLLSAVVAYSSAISVRRKVEYFLPLALAVLLTRLIIFLVNQEITPLPGLESDAVRFEAMASALSNDWKMVTWTFGTWAYGYTNALALVYYAGGPHPELLLLLNAFVVVVTLGEIAGVCALLGLNERARAWALWVIALWPLFVLYTSAPLREAPLILGLAMYVHGLLGSKPGREWRSVRGWLGAALSASLHIGFIVLIPAAILVSALRGDPARPRRGVSRLRTLSGVAITLIVVGMLPVYLTRLEIPKLGAVMNADARLALDAVVQAQEAKARGDGAYTLHYGWSPSPIMDLVLVGPEAAIRLLLSPYPWEIRGSALAIGIKLLDTVLHMILIAALVYRLRSRASQEQRILIGIYVLLAMVFGLGTGNDGIAARHRTKLFWIPVMVAMSPSLRDNKRELYAVSGAEQPMLVGQ